MAFVIHQNILFKLARMILHRLFSLSLVFILLFTFTGFDKRASTLEKTRKDVVKPRIIVTTDITNEPDDQESLIRLLLYANDLVIEGLIGSTGVWETIRSCNGRDS